MASSKAKPTTPTVNDVPVTRGILVGERPNPIALIESRAEARVREWFVVRKYSVCKGADVDVEASIDGVLKHVVEVKGDQFLQSGPHVGQINPGALRNTFFMGLGQLLIARTRHKDVLVSLALTQMYDKFVNKYVDVLKDHRISVIWVSNSDIRTDDLTDRTLGPRSR